MDSVKEATRNEDLDLDDLFRSTKKNEGEKEEDEIVVGTNPLLEMQKTKGQGLIVEEVEEDDGPKTVGTGLTEERLENVNRTLKEMDEQIEKLNLVKVTKKPKNGAEFAQLMDNLDNLDVDELKRMKDEQERGESGNIVKDDDLMSTDFSSATVLEGGENKKELGSGFFEAKGTEEIGRKLSEEAKQEVEKKKESPADVTQVVIEKREPEEGNTSVIQFTPEEREKMVESTQIELIQVRKININTGKVIRPDENFTSKFVTTARMSNAGSVEMTFVASKFRATFRGLTFGEYVDLALSSDITNVETLRKKLTVIYNAILDTSIGMFGSFDEFCRNFAFKDVDLGTYALYIGTNSEVLETGLTCGLSTCKNHFKMAFKPRNILRKSSLSPYFLEIMEKCGMADGQVALDLHDTSSIITKSIIELPSSGIAVEVGLRSCYDMINTVLPFINDIEDYINETYPDDTNKVRGVVTLITNYLSAIYFKDENGEFTIRMDNMKDMIEVLYNLPIIDYEIINGIIIQTDEDYALQFGIENVVCPQCGTKTEFVPIDIDNEVFRMFQELGSTRIDKKSLPRL